MPRKVAFSAKQKRAQLQDKRALKRGDLDLSEVRIPSMKVAPRSRSHMRTSALTGSDPRKLQSRFMTLPPDYVERTRNLAYGVTLERPLRPETARWDPRVMQRDKGRLTCPARPKFRVGATKKEVERNEEGWFTKWLDHTEGIVREWVDGEDERENAEGEDEGEGEGEKPAVWPRSPSWFEVNLEVWRQLWRVTESSQILLILADARCPPIHLPSSLRSYVNALKPRKEVIIVLTKSDLVDPSALAGWREWVRNMWAEGDAEGEAAVQVVAVKSYDTELLQETGRHRPGIPQGELDELVDALKNAHERLLRPPKWAMDKEEKMITWTPPVRGHVDWHLLSRGIASSDPPPPDTAAKEGDGEAETEEACGQAVERDAEGEAGQGDEQVERQRDPRDPDQEPLTVGLIGQPNVGKSSLLNALLGEVRVRASRTPGKTKHFQTMFWGWKKEVKIVDCPGLVCPSLAGMELQALVGILPISQIASLPSCIHHAAGLMPLENIFHLPPPIREPEDPYASKKTWRKPKEEVVDDTEPVTKWTAGEIMDARATDRGYVTAKSARPDANRAANGIMRALADGKVMWGFWPPDADVAGRHGRGIWIGQEMDQEDEEEEEERQHSSAGRIGSYEDEGAGGSDAAMEATDEEEIGAEESEGEGQVQSEEEQEQDEGQVRNARSFFAALDVEDASEGEEEDEEDEEAS